MKAKTKRNIFYVFAAFLFLSACVWAGSTPEINSTPVPLPGATPTIEVTVTNEPSPSPTIAAGSFADFHSFATEMDTALQDKNILFFDERVAPSVWNCLGDETYTGSFTATVPSHGVVLIKIVSFPSNSIDG